jgi:release factor glutamine methyltransferase
VAADLFSAFQPRRQFATIVSNPPYISLTTQHTLQPEVVKWEPASALFAGADGLQCIRRILSEAWRYLQSDGYLFLEIGADQGEVLGEIVKGVNRRVQRWKKCRVLPDLAGRPRVFTAVAC